MKKSSLAIALFAALTITSRAADPAASAATPAATAAAPTAETWKEYSFKEDHLAFSSPVEPVTTSKSVDSEEGKMAMNVYKMKTSDCLFIISSNEMPASAMAKGTPAETMKSTRDGFLGSTGTKASNEKEITIDGNPGLEFDFQSEAIHGTVRVYSVGNHLFSVFYVLAAATPAPASVAKFFTSFHLVKP